MKKWQSLQMLQQEQYAKRKARDDEAREAFNAELEKEDLNGLYMRDIIREEVTPDDARLR